MSTPTARKPLSNTPNSSPRRPLDGSPARPTSSASATSVGQGLARSPSLRNQRPVRRSNARMSTSFTPDQLEQEDEDEKNANMQPIADLKEQVSRAEQASEQYRKQLEVMQQRLDDATNEQTAAEERDFARQTELDKLRAEIKESARQNRELETSYESDHRMLLQERESQSSREAELQAVINRLNETLRNKGIEKSNASRAASLPDPADGGPDQSTMHLAALQEKDTVIEAMRLELAELHLQAAEQSHMGDGHLQDLEKEILDTKMQNARLLEENESFQMLLSEKTLKGDFALDHHEDAVSGLNSLAEELESAGDDPEAQSEAVKKIESENRALKDQNKALTLYVDKIIGRLLSNPGFEHIILDKDPGEADMPPPPPPKTPGKALPPTPAGGPDEAAQSAVGGFLQRARSVVARGNAPRPSRPESMLQASALAPTAHENPETAPSIPINRGHRRARSDQAQQDANVAAAAVVQQMTRSSTFRSPSSGPMSPGLTPLSPQLSSGSKPNYFPSPSNTSQAGSTTTTARVPSTSLQNTGSSRNSVASDGSFGHDKSSVTDASSVQISNAPGPGPAIPGAVMKQNQMRPLRLVNQVKDEEEAQKKANRGSWMGWFNRGAAEQAPQGYQ
ncbi:uncharacterized protein HMPREF1541_06017 [Cyphellophora europaea CBS 101466]|uniref:M protein, serotype 2.1 n=1 Tax=Cyphellophora europaea (strain CBS 101466) TaxID=1220924 RepID=W2RTE9_CYPE1|nr:uncharacterized protein HMPREF1541_06017 [Cyphellophora europaea CBS 101466]ETN39791.1 hypothetical protein HMPREF1541_06017 [Cyphellophora europaea CBS 101466]